MDFNVHYGKEASETVQNLLRKRLLTRIPKVYLRKTSEETLLYRWVNQRHPTDINSFFGHHQRSMSIGRQAIGMWETYGLMTRIDKANITTICNRGLCSTILKAEDRFDKAVAPRFLNGKEAQMVVRSLSMREVRGSMPLISSFSEEPGKQRNEIREAVLLDQKKTWICTSNWKGSIWNSTELAQKAIGVPNHHGIPQKDVGGNITTLMSESKTSVWHNQLHWTPPARHVNREGKRLACEKHMDWWPATTKPILQQYSIENSVQPLHWQKKGFRCH